MANDYVVKPTTQDYRVDSRVTVKQPHKPQSTDVCGTQVFKGVVSGVRMNATTWPSGT